MMMQDQLSKAQRIRLESLSQAINLTMLSWGNNGKPVIADFLANAKVVECFLLAAKDEK